jgi:hypothetical protein
MAIFRTARYGRFWVSDVCELLVEQDECRTIRRLLRQVGGAGGADFLTCTFSSARDAASYGFLRHGRGTVVSAFPLQRDLVPDPTQRASWALSRGDLELL